MSDTSKPSVVPRDTFFFLGEINKASIVMLTDQGIVSHALGRHIAGALDQLLRAEAAPGAARSADYLAFERRLVALGGNEASRIHSGRSRQDIVATIERQALRDGLLAVSAELNRARAALLELASRTPHPILPAYTWGVQAQPVSLGHYVTAYAAALTRVSERIQEAYARLNLSPLGSAALGTSSFAVDRERLAELLGMSGPLVNSLDATQISPIDNGAELAGIAISIALTTSALVADITMQYAQVRPWFTLEEGSLTGVSSIMPQKRNPRGLVMLRAQASQLIGLAQSFFLLAHNVQAGMSDYKAFVTDGQRGGNPASLLRELESFSANLEALLRTLRFNGPRAKEEVDLDYSTTTELADVLQRDADVPFRVGHHFASELVNYGRQNGLAPAQLPFQAARDIFARVAREAQLETVDLPLAESDFFRALSAENMVSSSRGLGGPQPAEVERMLAAEKTALEAANSWLNARQGALRNAEAALDHAFAALLDAS